MNRLLPWFLGSGTALVVIASVGCHEPSRTQTNSIPARTEEARSSAAAPSAVQSAAPGSPPPPSPSPSAFTATSGAAALVEPPEASEHGADPPLLDEQGKPLDQTDQRPTSTSPSFQKRIDLVARAILSGEVEPALPAFFPLVAYQQVKDVAKPERDYKFRLLANFKRDLLEYHRALGAAAAESKFEGITVSEKDAKWMAPGSEGNRLGYYRVLRSRLRFTLPTGRSRDFELTSLISWRGEWYVVHLHGFK